eukprot:CAMPEP_0171068286 /NCGR_PEP_ID=MMETSP0766_2-20121228/8478_1 /TAXON_ID=439317 /ORGANISM="Gambierdiscus australes, Strain CAWD 149" /LENGTH=186 /DNA_ID=CAMNT_0011524583 /DNA_START=136 /DNA_END=696 /DNA_ORIENTATION=+
MEPVLQQRKSLTATRHNEPLQMPFEVVPKTRTANGTPELPELIKSPCNERALQAAPQMAEDPPQLAPLCVANVAILFVDSNQDLVTAVLLQIAQVGFEPDGFDLVQAITIVVAGGSAKAVVRPIEVEDSRVSPSHFLRDVVDVVPPALRRVRRITFRVVCTKGAHEANSNVFVTPSVKACHVKILA